MLTNLGRVFNDYRILLYENNSADSTVALFGQWEQEDSRVRVTSETRDLDALKTSTHLTWDGKLCYIQMIAHGRNILLEQCFEPQYDDFDIIILCDMDLDEISIGGFLYAFKPNIYPTWDGFAANGRGSRTDDSMYDHLAYRSNVYHPYGPEILGEGFWNSIRPIRHSSEDGMVPVYSAYGGLSCYKKEALRGSYCSGIVTDDVREFYKQISNGVERSFVHNSGYVYSTHIPPVCSELFALHSTMYVKGFRRFFVNARFVLYQNRG